MVKRLSMAESHEVPALNCWISIALFTNVSNAAQLRGEATSGRIEAVLLDPTLVSAHPRLLSHVPSIIAFLRLLGNL